MEMLWNFQSDLSKNSPLLSEAVASKGIENSACLNFWPICTSKFLKTSLSSSPTMLTGQEMQEVKAISIPFIGISMCCKFSLWSMQLRFKNFI